MSIAPSLRSAIALLALVAACDDDGDPVFPDAGALDAFEAPWWTPVPGEAANWDIQLAAPLNVSTTRQMYMLDLWDVATATTIDYGGGSTVTVPNGPLAGKVTELKATGAIVVCHVDTGAISLDDPDASKFPGFEANPPNRPTNPDAGSVIGWSIIGDPDTRYLDIRATNRAAWDAVMRKRFDLAKDLGCDAVDVAWVDQLDPGFPLVTSGTDNDITIYYADIVAQLHMRELSAGMHVTSQIGRIVSDGFAESYDFVVIERCAEFDDCDLVRAFSIKSKAEFGLDFEFDGVTDRDGDGDPDGVAISTACNRALPQDWIHKDANAAFKSSSAYRMDLTACP